jgi:hypothetical protein
LRERIIDLFEEFSGGRKGGGQIGAHADRLRSLAGKDESPVHCCLPPSG